MACIPVAHSVPTAASIAAFVAAAYKFGPVGDCRFHTRGLNDTYALRAGTERFVLRCYRRGWRSSADIEYELAALLHLQRRGVPVSAPIVRRDGALVGHLDCPEGRRAVVLFTHGDRKELEGVDESRRYGQALARIHNATDDFRCAAARFRLDLDHLLNTPLTVILPRLVDRPADHKYLLALADRLRGELRRRAPNLSTGFCHGDASGNAHIANDTVTFFDFDCCGEGWRSDELSIFIYGQALVGRPDAAEHCAAFLNGYQMQRAILPGDRQTIPLFVLLRQIWHVGLHIAGADSCWGHGWINDAYLDHRFGNLRRWEESQMTDLLPQTG